MPRIAVFNQKGGVGKTTTALNLAAALAKAGEEPLTIDLDPQSHLTLLSGLGKVDGTASAYAFFRDHKTLTSLVQHSANHARIIPANLELAKVDTQFGKGPNVLNRLRLALTRENLNGVCPVIMDCSPVLGVLSLSALFAADKVLVPISADYLALNGALQVEKTLNALSPVLKKRIARRYVMTRFDGRRKMSWDIFNQLKARFGDEMCETRIAESVSLAESPFAEQDVFRYAPGSRGAKDYQALYEELRANDFLAAAA